MPARKLAGAVIAAPSKFKLMVRPPPEVNATWEPAPPIVDSCSAPLASAVSSGSTTGVEGGRSCGISEGKRKAQIDWLKSSQGLSEEASGSISDLWPIAIPHGPTGPSRPRKLALVEH